MAWIRTIPPEGATGELRERYEEAARRAGRVWNIVRLMSLRPQQIRDIIDGFYVTLMFQSHAHDLRGEVHDDRLVEAVERDYRTAPLDPRARTMLDYCYINRVADGLGCPPEPFMRPWHR